MTHSSRSNSQRPFSRTLAWICFALSYFVVQICAAEDAQTRLPDGTDFVFWEQPLTFSKTYFVDANSPHSSDKGPGTSKRPFRTISKAAAVLQPGERVVIASGVYRELVSPARGGTGPDKMISYEAAPGATVIVRGSEVLRDWQPSERSMRNVDTGDVHIWKHDLSGALFPTAYNPFAMASVPGDWIWLDTKRVDMGPYFRRRGMVFVDGKPLEPVEQYRELFTSLRHDTPAGQPPARAGLPSRTRGGPIVQEIAGSPDGRFWVEHQGNVLHIRVPNGDAASSLIEVTTREQVFAPRESGLGYIRIKGITFQHAGNAFPPPQHGLVSTNGGNHWIIEGNTIEWANGVGLDIGNQDWNFTPVASAGDSHIIRGNTIRYAGIEGIGGMGTKNTLVEDNLIEWVGWQDAERAWESAGAKFHFARNLLFRRNVIRHIRHANALWLDSGNQNCRITSNIFADVETVSAAIHMEMDRAPNQIDDNVIWDVRNAEPGTPGQRGAGGSGIFLHASEKQIVAQNLIGRTDNVAVFSVLREDRANSGTGREHKIYNNLFVRNDQGGIVFVHENNEADGNVYAHSSEHVGGIAKQDSIDWLALPAWQSHNWDRNGAIASLNVEFDPNSLDLKSSDANSLPKLPIFNRIESDFFGQSVDQTRHAGPFSDLAGLKGGIDPRHPDHD